ncbi:MAG: DUF3450 domain-containing protein [Proteobacteria bacterium]|jgi:predicted  nucleic acid-binding Zn-ribbon protein|nr:DUF3450 domain-containing protein [Pseudomonadota bacterium]
MSKKLPQLTSYISEIKPDPEIENLKNELSYLKDRIKETELTITELQQKINKLENISRTLVRAELKKSADIADDIAIFNV